jgi:Fe-S cluster biogenesis protein NfuA
LQLQAGKGSSINLQDVMQICAQCGMSSSAKKGSVEDQVMAMLDRFHNLGQLMHHQVSS